jgi:uncharacterized protein YxjI
MTTPANWYPDPNGRAELRYWDGEAWTDQVSTAGAQSTDPVAGGAASLEADSLGAGPTAGNEAKAGGGGGTIFTEPVLVVNQKAKLIELNNQYSVFGQDGQQLAMVNQVGQSAAKKVLRLVSSLDQFMTHKLQITDNSGQVLMQLTRPRKVMKSTVIVEDAAGNEIGKIVQQKAIGKINFKLEANGQTLGSIKGENWRRQRGRTRLQDLRGLRQGHVHHRRQLRGADPPADARATQHVDRGERPLYRYGAQARLRLDAGQLRLELACAGFGQL